MKTKRFRPAGGPCLTYDDAGDPSAPPVVLLHGGAMGWRRAWFRVAPRVAQRHRVLAPDLRGHGESERTPGAYGITDYADDVEALVEQVAGGPVALAGHSLGGLVAAHVAATRPHLVDSVFLEDVPLQYNATMSAMRRAPFRAEAFGASVRETIARGASMDELGRLVLDEWAATGRLFEAQRALLGALRAAGHGAQSLAETLVGPARRDVGSPIDNETAMLAVEGILSSDPEVLAGGPGFVDGYDAARPIACPVHMLRADPSFGPPPLGACFLPEHEDDFLATHPRASVEFVQGATHAIHYERPEWFAGRLLDFLHSVSGRPHS